MNMTTRRIGAVTAAAAVLLVLIWYAALLRPQTAHAKAAHTAYAAAQAKSAELQSQIATLQALLREVPADQARLVTLNAAVPARPALSDLLTQLHQDATATGVQLTAVTPAAPATSGSTAGTALPGGAHSLAVPLSVTGTYPSLMSFLRRLTSMPRVAVVDGLSLSPTSGGMTASLTVRVFYGA